MRVPVKALDQYGLISDQPAHELPPNAFSEGRNVRFRDGKVEKFQGHAAVFGDPPIAPYYLVPIASLTANWWVYPGLAKVYAYQGGGHHNITRQTAAVDVDYAATADNVWTGGLLGLKLVLNNGFDPPQKWADVSGSQRLEPLDYVTGFSTWASLNYRCSALRVFRSFLVALDVTKVTNRYPHMIKWSHPAVPGEFPVSWDETDPSKDAGEVSLSQTNGFVLDCAQLRDTNIIYKEDAVFGMQFVGGLNVFRFYPIFNQIGAMSRNCAVEYFSGRHFVFGAGDVVQHDGQGMESVLTRRRRRWLFSRINSNKRARCFVTVVPRAKECWACYPVEGADIPNEALVWNWETGALTVRDLPGVSYISPGVVDLGSLPDTWASDSEPWVSDATAWNARAVTLTEPEILMASSANSKFYLGDSTEQFAGQPMTAVVERSGLGIDGKDLASRLFLRSIFPRVEGPSGAVLKVWVGGQDTADSPIFWEGPREFRIGLDRKVDFRMNSRMLAVKFQSEGNFSWKLSSYDLDVDFVGRAD